MTTNLRARPVFIAALPREIRDLVRGWDSDKSLRMRGIFLYWNDNAVIACAGMGADRARLAVEAALRLRDASELVSIGWAGATDLAGKAGDLLFPDLVIDIKTGERFFTSNPNASPKETETQFASSVLGKLRSDSSAKPIVLVTAATPADVKEKQRLGRSYSASIVDMEGAAVARLAAMRQLPYSAIKGISDELELELPDITRFVTPRGQLREAAFGLHVALHPSYWGPVLRMAKGSKLAAGRLKTAVETYIQQCRDIHV